MRPLNLVALIPLFIVIVSCNTQPASKTEKSEIISLAKDTLYKEDITIFNSLDPKEILTRLFDNPYFDSSDMAIWQGNYSDFISLSIPLSFDRKYHTSLDTTLYFIDTKKRNCAVIIFSTYDFEPDYFDSSKLIPTGCHFCGVPIGVALFYQTRSDKWKLYEFKKETAQLGYFGVYKTGRRDAGKIELLTIGDQWTCLSLSEGFGSTQGYFSGGQTLLSIEQFNIDGSESNPLTNIFNNFYEMKQSYINANEPPQIRIVKGHKTYFTLNAYQQATDSTVTLKQFIYSPTYERYIEK